jgi:hypothetical protein
VTAALESAAAATALAVNEAETAVAALTGRRDELASELSKSQAEIDRLVATEQRNAGKRLLDGDDTVPPNPRRKVRVAALRDKIEAARGALELIEQRIGEASQKLNTAWAAHTSNVIAVCSACKVEGVAAIRDALAAVTPALRNILAAQLAQDTMIGKRFQVPPNVAAGLFHGESVVKKFVETLPERFKPKGWELDALVADATPLAAELTLTIEGRN